MEVNTANTPTISPAPIAVVAPPVQSPVTPQPNIAAMDGMNSMENGGTVTNSGSIKDFFKSLNVLEIGFSILGVAALFYTIHYYRFKLKEDKMINNELQRQIDEIKMNIQTAMKGKYKSI